VSISSIQPQGFVQNERACDCLFAQLAI